MTAPDPSLVEQVFHEACARAPGARREFLAARCAGDEALRREVEALLECEQTAPDGFLEGGAGPDEVGERVGRYRIVRRIGEGGFGSVFLGEQDEPVARQVALKVVKLGMDTRRVIRRFESERRMLALMDHPNVARIHDAGVTERGRPYFVMEYVDGPPITDYCDARSLPLEKRLELFMGACDAIGHAHHKGLIHRDIKPSNLLVATVDGRPMVKVIDFGVAKALSRGDDSSLLTEGGQILGTPEYMSPEQAAGAAGVTDTRADIYALGVLLYRLLSGRLPPGGPGAREPAPPSAAGDGPVPSRRLRGDLDWITMKAMAREVERRYASCAELVADLRRHLAGEPVSAGPPTASYRLRKFVGRHKVGVSAAGVVVVALAAGVGGTSWQAGRARLAERGMEKQRDAARLQTRRAEAVVVFVQDMLAEAAPGRSGGRDLTVREALHRAAARLDAGALVDDPEVEDAVRWTLGMTYMLLRIRPEAGRQFEWVVRHRRGALDAGDARLAEALYWLGEEQTATGQAQDALGTLAESLEIYRRLDEDHPQISVVLMTAGEAHLNAGDAARSEQIFANLVRLLQDDPHRATQHTWSMFGLARAQAALGKTEAAVEMLERVRPLAEEHLARVPIWRAMFVRWYAEFALARQGQLEQAEALMAGARQTIEDELGPRHPDSRACSLQLAMFQLGLGRSAEAMATLDLFVDRSGEVWPASFLAVRALAQADLGQGGLELLRAEDRPPAARWLADYLMRVVEMPESNGDGARAQRLGEIGLSLVRASGAVAPERVRALEGALTRARR